MSKLFVLACAAAAALVQGAAVRPDPPHTCADCDAWNAPRAPFRIFGNSYYVGVADLSSVLIVGDAGSILIDGGLPQSAPLIDANIRTLGFKTEDVRLIVNSHEHYDHVGGLAALQRISGAQVAAREPGKRALERGEPTPDDPQFAFGREANAFPALKNVRTIANGETLRVGALAITAHAVPGHTPGSTAWTWRSCEGARCHDIVYADSLTPVSAPDFKFTGDASHPSLVPAFRASIEAVRALPCDIIVSAHPSASGLWDKVQRRSAQSASDPLVNPDGCRAYAAAASRRLDARVAEERHSGGPAR